MEFFALFSLHGKISHFTCMPLFCYYYLNAQKMTSTSHKIKPVWFLCCPVVYIDFPLYDQFAIALKLEEMANSGRSNPQ